MFGGYADVAVSQFYMEANPLAGSGDDEEDTLPLLPDCYMPPYLPPDPWHQLSPCQQDFILIAEFSEMEGPKPLITIPNNGEGNFDLNSFSLRIMSVDHQSSGDSFAIPEDTHVILSENQEGIHAYVHHFTLYDSQARGFVRPFCMAYVTPCARKLMCFYEEMRNEFSKVSRFFHYGNLMLFVKDMTHYLTDLQFTREKVLERENLHEREVTIKVEFEGHDITEEKILQTLTLTSIEHCIQEVKAIIEKASKMLTDRRLEERFQHLEEKCREERRHSSEDSSQLSSSFTTPSGSPFASREWLLHRIKKAGSFSDLQHGRKSDLGEEIYKPKLVCTLNRRRFDKSLRTLHQLCHWGAKEGLTRLRSIHRYFNRDLATLEIERTDSSLIEPASSLLTIGRCVMANFLSSADQEYALLCKRGYPTSNLLRRWVSDDTLASFKSAESFLSCHEGYQSGSEATFIMGSAYVGERDSLASYDILSLSSRDEEMCNGGESLHVESARRSSSSCGESPRHSPRLSESCFEFGCDEERGRKPSILWRQGSVDDCETENCRDSPDPSRKCHKVPIISAADHIVRLRIGSPGHGILRLMELYSFMVHVLFTLLCGRPLVVIGGTKVEKEVKAVINALLLFVPGHSSRNHQVVYWQTHPLRLTDLCREKVIGLCRPDRKMAIPSYIKPYVSVLDIEKKTFYGPSYQGGLLSTIYSKRKSMKCEKAYVAFIHSILQDLSSKALIYYHSFKLGQQNSSLHKAMTQWQSPHIRHALTKASQDFMTKLKLSSDDGKIVLYLTEVVKLQQLEELRFSSIPEKELPCPSFRLSHAKCSLHKS